jgi:hypothetical protein
MWGKCSGKKNDIAKIIFKYITKSFFIRKKLSVNRKLKTPLFAGFKW